MDGHARLSASPEGQSLQGYHLGVVLVTGGSGGLDHQILLLLAQRRVCSQLHSVDIRTPHTPLNDVHYHTADLTDERSIRELFQDVHADVIIHCASPRFDASKDAMRKINIEGTRLLVDLAKGSSTTAFVYTSSASVVSDANTDLRGADETYPLVTGAEQPEFYVHTKALAEEYVLSQNRPVERPEFLTCAIRPSGIVGVGDSWDLPGILDAFYRGRTRVQIGENKNLFDFTENTNVAHAHHLAAAALVKCASQQHDTVEHDRVDGEAFFITNDEPVHFWDFSRMAWRYAGDTTSPNQIWVIPKPWAMRIATVMAEVELYYYSIEKAKQRLGYWALIGLAEGLRRGVEDCKSTERLGSHQPVIVDYDREANPSDERRIKGS